MHVFDFHLFAALTPVHVNTIDMGLKRNID
jgi:hypothetical protein